MNCEQMRALIPLSIYGELSFREEDTLENHLERCVHCRAAVAHERSLHRLYDAAAVEPPPELLLRSRQELRRNLSTAPASLGQNSWLRDLFSLRFAPMPAAVQFAGSLALILLGFLTARAVPVRSPASVGTADIAEPVSSRVRYVEPEGPGRVQLVVEETRQKTVTGNVNDEPIRRWLLAAAKDGDPGLRVESVDALKNRPEDTEVRNALLYSVQHDANAGVRLKALEGLKASADEAHVRQVLSHVLLTDANPGVRTQVVDLLVQHKEDRMVGVLQELMRKEDNGYVRMRCEKALQAMKASVETY